MIPKLEVHFPLHQERVELRSADHYLVHLHAALLSLVLLLVLPLVALLLVFLAPYQRPPLIVTLLVQYMVLKSRSFPKDVFPANLATALALTSPPLHGILRLH